MREARARILVVDDERRLAETFALALRDRHDVELETTGYSAKQRLLEDAFFDLVLCDLMMPDVSGPELFAEIEARRPEQAARFVFMTGGAFTQGARDFLQRVANPRLEKPFSLTEIERLLAEFQARATAGAASGAPHGPR